MVPKQGVILTSSQQQWIIHKGDSFKATQDPKEPARQFVAGDDLVVMYKGKLEELEKAADSRMFTAADAAKTKGLVFGAIASLLTLFAGIYLKGLAEKIFKPK
jgi:hypothetical protein